MLTVTGTLKWCSVVRVITGSMLPASNLLVSTYLFFVSIDYYPCQPRLVGSITQKWMTLGYLDVIWFSDWKVEVRVKISVNSKMPAWVRKSVSNLLCSVYSGSLSLLPSVGWEMRCSLPSVCNSVFVFVYRRHESCGNMAVRQSSQTSHCVCVCVVSDEMYQVVVYMPEDVPFNCRVCCPERPSPWQMVVQQEMYSGMKGVLDALISSHSSFLLQPIDPVSTSHCHLIVKAQHISCSCTLYFC